MRGVTRGVSCHCCKPDHGDPKGRTRQNGDDAALTRAAETDVFKGVAAVLADQFFLIAHEDRTGRSRLHPRATGLGLAAALLGELMLEHRLRIFDGDLYIENQQPPRDSLSHDILELLVAQPQHRDVRTWLAFLSQDAAVKVGERMTR